MKELVIQIAMFMATYLLIVVAHELGHWVVLKAYLKKNSRFVWTPRYISCGTDADMNKLSKEQYRTVMWVGIITGFLALVLAWDYWLSDFGMILLFMLYCFGSKSDFINIIRSFKR